MNIVKTIKQRVPYVVTSMALLLAAVAPGIISTQAFAAQVTERSIALSSSAATATGVQYDVNFTSVSAAGAFVVTFCSNSPDPVETCTVPAGFSAAAVATATSGYTVAVGSANNKLIVTHTIGAADPVAVSLTGLTNPTAVGPLYARVATFADATAAGLGTSPLDNGSVVISINNTISVSGAVLESLTFCVASDVIIANCGDAAAHPPILALGETVGTIKALQPDAISTGSLYTQISTNAATGAVITLKSSTACGGLQRGGATTCEILPALQTGITAGQAKFGVRTATATGTNGAAFGTLQPITGSGYNATTYTFNYVGTNASGVTSTLGDPFLDTAGAPAANQNMQLTFGASVAPQTPAGNYSTSLNMIATGKF